MRNLQLPLKQPRRFQPGALSPVERCILRNFGGSLEAFHAMFTPPPERLRMACDHDDGSLLGWKYGEAPSFKGQAPPDPGHVLHPPDQALSLTPPAAARQAAAPHSGGGGSGGSGGGRVGLWPGVDAEGIAKSELRRFKQRAMVRNPLEAHLCRNAEQSSRYIVTSTRSRTHLCRDGTSA